jgi:hypothetical protein
VHILACELTVHGREGVELVLEQVLVLGVKEAMGSAFPHAQLEMVVYSHSDELVTVLGNTGALADNLRRPDEVLEHLLVDGGEGAGTGTLLLVGGAGFPLWLGEDSALGDENDVFVRELLLELTGKAKMGIS